MAETITTDDLTTVGHTRKVYDAMRFTPGQILLDEHDCINSVVDTGASLSMVERLLTPVGSLAPWKKLTRRTLWHQDSLAGKILRNAQVQSGLSNFAVDPVVTTLSLACCWEMTC